MEGTLLGGNLTVLASGVGAPCGPMAHQDSIWLLEDVGEARYRLERAFWQLKGGGCLIGSKGIWLGDLDLQMDEFRKVSRAFGMDGNLPVREGAPAGHRGPLSILPIGMKVRIEPESGRLTTDVPWVETR